MDFVVVHNIPSPYRLHLFEEMNRQLRSKGHTFHVHFMSDLSKGHEDRPLSWRNPKMSFAYTYWKDYGFRNHHFNPSLIWHLMRHRPDVLMVGSSFDTITGLLCSLLCKAKTKLTWTEGNTKTLGQMKGLKGWIKRLVFSSYKYVAVPGREGELYIAEHQKFTSRTMPRPVLLPNLIDETRFKPRAFCDRAKITEIRASLGCDEERKLCIIPARLEWYKGLVELIDALPREQCKSWKIVIMGEGSLRERIVEKINEKQLSNVIWIKDFIPYAEMPLYYAAADLFLLASFMDRNPLSVVEALHAGLPIALSDQVGNITEAVGEGVNGWVLPVRDTSAYKMTLAKVFSASTETLRKFGRNSYEKRAEFWRTKSAVSSFIKGIGVS